MAARFGKTRMSLVQGGTYEDELNCTASDCQLCVRCR